MTVRTRRGAFRNLRLLAIIAVALTTVLTLFTDVLEKRVQVAGR